MQSRREFLKESAIVSMLPTLPAFLPKAFGALPGEREKILVVVQLSGGNDGLNTVIPYRDDGYLASRPALKIPADNLLKVDDRLALHPSLGPFEAMLQKGRLAIVQDVGYPEPNRSHDVSMAIWHTAKMDQELHRDTGWLGRCLDRKGLRPQVPSAIVTGLDETPMALRGRKSQISQLDSLEDFLSSRLTQFDFSRTAGVSESTATPRGPQPSLVEFMRQTAVETQWSVEQFRSVMGSSSTVDRGLLARLGSPLARQMSVIFDLIRADFGTTVYYAAQSGYDTHSNQLNAHSNLLSVLATTLDAFLKDLEASGHADRVLVMCFSEFGRQVHENASLGTDHGTSGPLFLIGNKVRSGMHGTTPNLEKLTEDAPHFTTDFRDVYAGILKHWLDVDPVPILDGHAGLMPVIHV